MLQPDEETGSAGERPVSNMATPIQITRTVRESSWWRLLFCLYARHELILMGASP